MQNETWAGFGFDNSGLNYPNFMAKSDLENLDIWTVKLI